MLPLRLFDRGHFKPLLYQVGKKAPTLEGAKHTSKFDASASRVFEGALMSSDAEIFLISQCEFEALMHQRSGVDCSFGWLMWGGGGMSVVRSVTIRIVIIDKAIGEVR